jgi:GNAT superfamily N-acetyltransferase
MNPTVKSAAAPEEILRCLDAMSALRPHLNKSNIVSILTGMMKNGYHLVYIEEDDLAAAACGYRFTEHLAWGKVIYIDDLTTHPGHRKKGYAKLLLDYVCSIAASAGCDQVHLDSGCNPQRYDAHRLYLKYGFNITSHHFAISIK